MNNKRTTETTLFALLPSMYCFCYPFVVQCCIKLLLYKTIVVKKLQSYKDIVV